MIRSLHLGQYGGWTKYIPAKCVLDTFQMLTAWLFEMDGTHLQKLHHGQYGDRTHDIRVISTTL